jgi:hypothetical protein
MHKFGFVLLITLLLFANGNDILRQLSGSKKSEKNIFACTKQITIFAPLWLTNINNKHTKRSFIRLKHTVSS